MLECICCPVHGTGGQFRPGSSQRVLLGKRRSRAVLVRAAPGPFVPQQPHRPAETGDVVEPYRLAAVPDRDDAAVRATGEVLAGLDAQNQAGEVYY